MATLRRVHFGALPAAVIVLVLARYLPAETVTIYLRLAAATVIVFYPGLLVSQAFGRRSLSATLVTSLGLLAACMGVMFLVKGSFWLALALYGACGLVGLVFAWRAEAPRVIFASSWVLLVGVVLGLLLWRVAGVLHGDQLFHLARTRKLLDFGSLTPGAVNEFADGSLHPGYAFPLWHGLLAAFSRLAGVDPGVVVLHEPSVLTPAAVLIAYEAGWAIFRSWRLAVTAVVAQLALVVIAPGFGGSYTSLALPATVGRHLLVPAVIALFFIELDDGSPAGLVLLGIASLVLAIVHVTYVIYALAPLAAYLLVRLLVTTTDFKAGLRAFAAVSAPAIAFMAVITPLIGSATSYDPTHHEVDKTLHHYGSQIVTYADGLYALAPEMLARAGAIAVAALVLTVLAFMAAKRRWSAFVLGGALAVFLLTLVPWLFVPFSNLVSISQARRLSAFYPYAFAFAGGLGVLTGLFRRYTLVIALAAAIALQRIWPGNFGYYLHSGGGPGWLVWTVFALVGVSLVCYFLSPEADFADGESSVAILAAVAFTIPIAVAGFSHWTPAYSVDKSALSPGLTRAIQTKVPDRAIVLADPPTSYRILAIAPVYVVTAPPGNVADTKKNRPYQRRSDVWRFLKTGDLDNVAVYRPGWLVLTAVQQDRLKLAMKPVYHDRSFALYRLPGSVAGT